MAATKSANVETILVWKRSEDVFIKKNVTYDKPTAEVMDSNFGRRADHFVIFTDISRSEIDENVNDEHDINCRKKDRNSIRMNFIWILLESIFMKM